MGGLLVGGDGAAPDRSRGVGGLSVTALARATPGRSWVLLVAWAGVLATSALIPIVWRTGLSRPDSSWLDAVQLALVLALLAGAWSIPSLRPLRLLFVVLSMQAAGFLVLLLGERITGFTAWAARAPDYLWIPAQSALFVLPTALMVVTALAAGLTRRDLFLVVGDLHARSRIPGTARFTRWHRQALPLIALFLVPLLIQLTLVSRPDLSQLGKALALLPLGIGFALVNAAQEEIRFRAVPIALLEPSVGAEAAIWMTAAAFGLGHWYGHPSGPTGVLLAFAAGLVLAKAFVETRGLASAWVLHAILDVVIFLFIVMEG
jgi:membrane protease YdiL (CAAX protease family)